MNGKDDVERCRALAGNCREVEARQRVDMRPRDCHYATEPRYLQDLPRSSRPTVTRSEHDGSVGPAPGPRFTCSLTRRADKSIAGNRDPAASRRSFAKTSREGYEKIADYKSLQVAYLAGSIMDSKLSDEKARS